jgi:RNA polymerase sigma-70 factor (ECF subfamily)
VEPVRPQRCIWVTGSGRKRGAGGGRLDDAEAVALARDGDLDAFEVLVARHTALAHRTAALLGAGPDAPDVVQEAFVKAYRGLPWFRDGAPFRPWLLRIVANEAHNAHRSSRRRSTAELRLASVDSLAAVGESAESSALRTHRRDLLLAAVRDLPEKYRLVVTCRYFLDLSEAETATVLGWPRGSVKSRLSRALGRLRTALDAELTEEVRHG